MSEIEQNETTGEWGIKTDDGRFLTRGCPDYHTELRKLRARRRWEERDHDTSRPTDAEAWAWFFGILLLLAMLAQASHCCHPNSNGSCGDDPYWEEPYSPFDPN